MKRLLHTGHMKRPELYWPRVTLFFTPAYFCGADATANNQPGVPAQTVQHILDLFFTNNTSGLRFHQWVAWWSHVSVTKARLAARRDRTHIKNLHCRPKKNMSAQGIVTKSYVNGYISNSVLNCDVPSSKTTNSLIQTDSPTQLCHGPKQPLHAFTYVSSIVFP